MNPWLQFVGSVLVVGMAGCRPSEVSPTQPAPLKVAFLYADAHADLAREAIVAEFGARIQVQAAEQLRDEVQTEESLRTFVNEGYGLIFSMAERSSGSMAATRHVAADAQTVHFEQWGGPRSTANLRVFEARTYEGAYLAGVVAGTLSQTHTLGVDMPILSSSLEGVRIVNAFTLGAQSVEPKSITRVAWGDRGWDRDGGVDMVLRSTDGVSLQLNLNPLGTRGEPLITFEVHWAPYYRQAIQAALAQTWVSGDLWWGLREDVVVLASMSPAIAPPLRAHVERVRDDIKKGQMVIWRGPLWGQDGKPVLRRDEVASDKFLYGMNFYVKGVEGRAMDLYTGSP